MGEEIEGKESDTNFSLTVEARMSSGECCRNRPRSLQTMSRKDDRSELNVLIPL